MRQLSILLAVLFTLTGCATTTRTETTKTYTETKTVRVGDDVQVTTHDGRKLEFRVTAMDAKTLQGRGISVVRADISSVKTIGLATVTTQESSAQPIVEAVSTLSVVMGVVAVVAILAVF